MFGRPCERGQTLVDVVVAVALLGLAVCMIGYGTTVVHRSQGEAAAGLAAVWLAQSEAERMKGREYSVIRSVPEAPVAGCPGFTRKVDVTEVDGRRKRITVTVTYPTAGLFRSSKSVVIERSADSCWD